MFLKIKLIVIALLAGMMMGLTTAPVSWWYLAWIALIPLWILINNYSKSLRDLILFSLAWGFGYHGVALFWITGIHPMTWMGVPWLASLAIALFCWLFISFWGALLVVIWSLLFTFLNNKIPQKYNLFFSLTRILIGVSIWCLLESLWSNTPLWWSSLSYSQSPNNLAILQILSISGSNTLTAAIIAVNGLFAEAFIQKRTVSIPNLYPGFILLFLGFFLLTSLHLIGYLSYQSTISVSAKDKIKIGIIQGNIPNEIKLYPGGWRKAIEGYTTGYQKLAKVGVELIITPETALPFYWHDLVARHGSLFEAILTAKVPVIVGAFDRQENSFTNSLFLVTGEGKIFSSYDKVKLVPLGEYIPFEQVLGKVIDRLSPLDAHLIAGKTNQIVDTPWGRAIVGICYESAFPEHFRRQAAAGGEFIITASNNAHYSETMPAQDHALDIMRAIETDRWLARATNTGYSAIVNPHGDTIWLSEINQYQLHVGKIYRRQTSTLYVKWGDWLTKVLLLFSLISYFYLST